MFQVQVTGTADSYQAESYVVEAVKEAVRQAFHTSGVELEIGTMQTDFHNGTVNLIPQG